MSVKRGIAQSKVPGGWAPLDSGLLVPRAYLPQVAGLLHNMAASAAPTVNDDSGDGYAVGSQWLDTTNDRIWMCIDATVGAAVWRLISRSAIGCKAIASAATSVLNTTFTPVLLAGADMWDTDNFHFTSAANLTGTVSKSVGSPTITGSGTSFTTELSVNQVITIPGTTVEVGVVKSIESNTSLTLWQNMGNNASGQTAQRRNEFIAIPAGLGGRYLVVGQCGWDSNTVGERILEILQNGSSAGAGGSGVYGWSRDNIVNANGMTRSVPVVLSLTAGSFFTMLAYQTSTGTRTTEGTNRTQLTAEYLGS